MELRHHGIKGMKWGRRRFQNDDGSLKPAGEKRYGDPTVKKTSSKQKTSSNKPAVTPKPKVQNKPANSSSSSNKKSTKTSSKKAPTKKKVDSGKKSAGHVLSTLGKVAAANAVRMAENRQTVSMVDNMMSGDFGSAYSDAWAASKYRNVYGMLD